MSVNLYNHFHNAHNQVCEISKDLSLLMHLFDQCNKHYFIFTQISCRNEFLNHLNSKILS